MIVHKLIPASIKVIKQRQEAGIRVARMKKTPKRIDNGLSDQHKQDNYKTDESEDSQSNGVTHLDKIEDLNISY